RWFEEWAEDFCRKRKHKLENAKKKCRDDSRNLYCSGNGFDCTKTIRGQHVFVEGECHDCSVACSPFVKWLDNQKLEFDKQKRKYAEEMKKYANGTIRNSKRPKRSTNAKEFEGYEKKFYEILGKYYPEVEDFLEKLSKEGLCEKQPKVEVEEGKAGSIDFQKRNTEQTFSRTKICEPCPWCGAERKSDGNKWKAKEDKECRKAREIRQYEITEIPILTAEERKSGIINKYRNFCEDDERKGGDQIKTWKCYYKEKNQQEPDSEDINFCVLQDDQHDTEQEKSMHYNAFFWKWVHDILIDSIQWRDEHSKCINKEGDNTCKRGCNKRCKCFLKWVKQKEKEEWKKIVEHFKKQGDLAGAGYQVTLEYLLKKDELLKIIEDTYGKSKETEHIKDMLEEDEATHSATGVTENNTTMDKLLAHELEDAQNCLTKHPDNDCPKPQSRLRSEPDPSESHQPNGDADDDEDDDDDDDDEEEDGDESSESDSPPKEGEKVTEAEEPKDVPPPPPANTFDACKIVANLFSETTNLTAACAQKYSGNNRHLGWKCVTQRGSNNQASDTERGGADGQHLRLKRSPRDTEGVSGPTTSGDATEGAICVPPRRRKLYVTPLMKLGDTTSVTSADESQASRVEGETSAQDGGISAETPRNGDSPEGSPPATQSSSPNLRGADDLRKAFVESAAIETWFLWHRHVAEWKKRQAEEQGQIGLVGAGLGGADAVPGLGVGAGVPGLGVGVEGVPGVPGAIPGGVPPGGDAGNGVSIRVVPVTGDGDDENGDPEAALQRGEIPQDFLRQMFYTLGDYKDIFFGVSDVDVKGALKKSVVNTSGDQESSSDKDDPMTKIENAIKTHINSLKSHQNGPPKPGNQANGDITPESLWEKDIGPQVWNGMICALTYKENDDGTQIVKNTDVEKALFGKDNPGEKTPKNPDTDGGTYQKKYTYKEAKLEPDPTQALHNNESQNPGTPLTEFITRPTYFRWLEEWGESFCKERSKRLENISEECMDDSGNQKYSGDGETCTERLLTDSSTFNDLEGRSCANSCRYYKRWIERKGKEYKKQENAFEKQKGKCQNGSVKDDDAFCKKLNTWSDVVKFLHNFGPCSKNNDDTGKDNGGDKLVFTQPNDTFVPATNCKPCNEFKIHCDKGKCNGDGINGTCNGGTINASTFDTMGEDLQEVLMRVSDKSGDDVTNGLEDCKKAGIFGVINQKKYTCRKFCGHVVCKSEQDNGQANGKIPLITLRALLQRWLENFFEDYYKIKKKLKACMNDKGSKCENNCVNNCNCAKVWIVKKLEEWNTIKTLLNKQYKDGETEMASSVSSSLKDWINRFAGIFDKGDKNGLEKLGKLFKCKCLANSENSEDNDYVNCLLKNLETKANECEQNNKHSATEPCPQTTQTDNSLPDDEDDYLPLDPLEPPDGEQTEEEKKKMLPTFCDKDQVETKKVQDEVCEPASSIPKGDAEKPEEAVEPTNGEEPTTQKEEKPVENKVNEDKGSVPPTPPKTPPPGGKKSRGSKKRLKPRGAKPPQLLSEPLRNAMLSNTLAWCIGIGITGLSYWALMKVKNICYVVLFMCFCVCFVIEKKIKKNNELKYIEIQLL
ncbi:erythrocyte membrane protein 1, PfEMP1, putative, partial [Plasmodium sp. DRC-Itaito]